MSDEKGHFALGDWVIAVGVVAIVLIMGFVLFSEEDQGKVFTWGSEQLITVSDVSPGGRAIVCFPVTKVRDCPIVEVNRDDAVKIWYPGADHFVAAPWSVARYAAINAQDAPACISTLIKPSADYGRAYLTFEACHRCVSSAVCSVSPLVPVEISSPP